jgi:hypothetical protein
VGVLCSSVLYGVATTQAFLYSQARFKDPIWLRIFVSTANSHPNYLSIFLDLRLDSSGWSGCFNVFSRLTLVSHRILETAHTVFIWSFIYSLTVVNFGNTETINEASWSLFAAILFTTLLGTVVQASHPHPIHRYQVSNQFCSPFLVTECGCCQRGL